MKTISLKKVAVVAVASLGFGLLSVIPAQAAVQTATVTSISLANSTTSPPSGAAVVVNLGYVIPAQSVAALAAGDDFRFQAALTTVPAGGSTGITGQATIGGGGAATFIDGLTTGTVVAGGAVDLNATAGADALDTIGTTSNTITASATVGSASFSFTPTKGGVYVMTVWHDTGTTPDKTLNGNEVYQTISITVAAAADLVPSASTAFMTTPGANGANASAATNAIPRAGSSAAGTHIAQIKVNLFKSDGTADASNHTLTCEISGAGYCGFAAVNTDPNSTSRSATNSTGANDRYVGVEADGTAGTGTVSIYVTHAVTAVKTLIYTGSFTSYGDVTKLEVSSKIYTIGRAGYTTGAPDANLAARTAAGNTKTALAADGTVPAFIVKMTDSGGRAANRGANPTVISSNAAVVSGGTCALDDGSAVATGDSSSTNGVGFYNCNFDTASSAKSGDKATLTLRVTDPADTTLYLTTTIDVTVGGSIATETLAFDKTSYAPGEGLTLTMTAKDSAGNPVYDGAASPAVTFNKAVGGTSPAAGQYVGGVKSSTGSTGTKTVFAPSIGGAFTANATSGNAAGSAISASASVTDANAGLLTQIDALNAKIVALNALIAKIMKKLGVK